MSYGVIDQSVFTDIADAIRAQNGEETTYLPSEMPAAIAAIEGSGGSTGTTEGVTATDDGVNFVDHDGTCLYAYSWDEIAEMTELPELPEWTAGTQWGFSIPMACTGWNWDLESIQALSASGRADVGAIYEPADGATHFIVRVHDGLTIYLVNDINLLESGTATVTVDWGDGSDMSTYTASSTTSGSRGLMSHTYEDPDEYVDIAVTCDNATIGFGGSSSYGALGATVSNSTNLNSSSGDIVSSALLAAYLSGDVSDLANYAFRYAHNLTELTLPGELATLGSYALQYDYALAIVTLPKSISYIRTYVLDYCYMLNRIISAPGVDISGTSCLRYCYSLNRVSGLYIEAGSTATGIFTYCYHLTYLDNVQYIGASVSFAYSPLNYVSIINLFNALDEDIAGTVTLSSDSYALLSDDDLAIATDKGWTVTA